MCRNWFLYMCTTEAQKSPQSGRPHACTQQNFLRPVLWSCLFCFLFSSCTKFGSEQSNSKKLIGSQRLDFPLRFFRHTNSFSNFQTKLLQIHRRMAHQKAFQMLPSKKHVHSRNLQQACQNVGPPQFTVLSRCGRSFHAVGGPFHAYSRGFTFRFARPKIMQTCRTKEPW